jgi:hypothetical protein
MSQATHPPDHAKIIVTARFPRGDWRALPLGGSARRGLREHPPPAAEIVDMADENSTGRCRLNPSAKQRRP